MKSMVVKLIMLPSYLLSYILIAPFILSEATRNLEINNTYSRSSYFDNNRNKTTSSSTLLRARKKTVTFPASFLSSNKRSTNEHGVQEKKMMKVYVLAGQSNMEGHGEVATMNKTSNVPLNGTLLYQLLDPRTRDDFSKLWDYTTGDWRTLPNVKVWFNEAGAEMGMNGSTIPGVVDVDYSAGDLTVGFGTGGPTGNNKNFFGPELGFGFRLNVPEDEKILIVKTAWGGKDIAVDFRPPSSTSTEDPYCQLPDCDPSNVGHFYKVMVDDVNKILEPGVINQIFPDLVEEYHPVVSGFGWFQGWNDGCDLNKTAAYEQNLVNLIQDLRNEWNSPHLPVSIAVSGFDGFNGIEQKRQPPNCWDDSIESKLHCDCGPADHGCRRIDIILSQFGAANLDRHPELGCCVVAMETRGFWREAKFSPNHNQGYHFYHNAETHFRVGEALAKGIELATVSMKLLQTKNHSKSDLGQVKNIYRNINEKISRKSDGNKMENSLKSTSLMQQQQTLILDVM